MSSPRGDGFYRWLLRLWPADFRQEHGEEAVVHHASARAEAEQGGGRGAMLRFWVGAVVDVVVTAVAERLSWREAALSTGAGFDSRAGTGGRLRLDGLWLDVRYGIRAMVRAPAFALSVVVTLALGVGATTAVFTVVDAMLVRPLPYADPERLVELHRAMPGFTLPFFDAAFGHRLGENATAESFVRIAGHERLSMVLGSGDEPRDVRVHAASASLFEVLGRQPFLGRSFLDEDMVPGAPPVALLTHGTWQSLGAPHGIIGETIELDGTVFAVIGVLPRDFRFPKRFSAEVFIPLGVTGRAAGLEVDRVQLIGRLAAGTSVEAARDRLADLSRFIRDEHAITQEWEVAVVPLADNRANPDVTRALLLAAGAVAVLFVIAVVNGLNLILARLVSRARELTMRASLGATRARLLRQIMAESLLLALLGGLTAIVMAAAGRGLFLRFAPAELTLHAPNGIVFDQRVLGFAFVTTLLAGLTCATVPGLLSLRWARAGTAATARSAGSTSREHTRFRSALVIAQVALAITLMAGAGLLIGSFARLLDQPTGFDTRNLVLLEINPNERAYGTAEQRAAFGAVLEDRFRSLPGVIAVTRANGLPPQAGFRVQPRLQVEGETDPRPDSPFILPWAQVRPDYLTTLGTPLMAGRNFDGVADEGSDAAIIDRDLARFLWNDENVVGRRFRMSETGSWLTVVGLVDDLMLGMPDGSYGNQMLLRPAPASHDGTYFAIRATGDPAALIAQVRAVVHDVDSNQPIYSLATARQAIIEELGKQRFFLIVVAALAGIALTLTAIGIYGLLSFLVARRSREIGIRMALGAHARVVLVEVVGSGMRLVGAGAVLGLAGTLIVGRTMESMVFEIEPTDPATLLGVCVLLGLVAALACLLPAGRAARVDPVIVLKADQEGG